MLRNRTGLPTKMPETVSRGTACNPTSSSAELGLPVKHRIEAAISVGSRHWTRFELRWPSWGDSDFYGLTDRVARNNIVITMRAIHVSIRQIGNSQGVVIPKPVLAQLGLDAKAGVEMTIEDGALVLRRPASPARTGWAEAARSIAEAGDDELVMGEFGNADDSELVW